MDMQGRMEVLWVQGGVIDDNGQTYSSLLALEDDIQLVQDSNRVAGGRRPVKMNMPSDDNYKMARDLLADFTFPCHVELSFKGVVKGNQMVMSVTGYKKPSSKAA